MPDMSDESGGRLRLTGWRDIGAYVGRAGRTVQRWEREFGLPIHRTGSRRSDAVVAYTDEIDAWLRTGGATRAMTEGEGTAAQRATSAVPTASTSSDPTVVRFPGADSRPANAGSDDRALISRLRKRHVAWVVSACVCVVVVVAGLRFISTSTAGVPRHAHGAASASAFYKLDEGTGDAIVNAAPGSSGGANGRIANGVWTQGVVGRALDFGPGEQAGRHMVVVFPGAFPFHAPGTDASLTFWVRPVDGTHRTLFWTRSDPHSPDANRFHLYTGGVQRVPGPALGVDYISPEGAIHILFEVPIRVNEWTHVALTRVGVTTYTLYLDGKRVATAEDANPRLPTYRGDWGLWRAQDNPLPRQNGMLDEIGLWTRALAASEVEELAKRVP